MSTQESTYKKKIAFTLAEVLITLGIIGVVAAMTMPALIQNYEKQATVTGLKKFYNIISNAKVRSEVDNEEMKNWNFISETLNKEDDEAMFDKYFRPYMKGVKQCSHISQCKSFSDLDLSSHPIYILSDGMQFLFSTGKSAAQEPYFFIKADLNGNKTPNREGKDIFALNIRAENGVFLMGGSNAKKYSRTQLIEGIPINDGKDTACCNTTCTTESYKYYTCGALIQLDGWEIREDYPW